MSLLDDERSRRKAFDVRTGLLHLYRSINSQPDHTEYSLAMGGLKVKHLIV